MNFEQRALSEMPQLPELPEEMWEEIFTKVQHLYQLDLIKVSDYFRDIIGRIWRRDFKAIDVYIRDDFVNTKQNYIDLVEACHTTLKVLRTYQLIEPETGDQYVDERFSNLDRLDCISHLDFPMLTVMQCALDCELPSGPIDFGKSMPALEHLGLYYSPSGPGRLTLEVPNIVASVRTIVKCNKLQTLEINGDYLGLILDEVLQMPYMRKVVTFREDFGTSSYNCNRSQCDLTKRIGESPVIQRVHTFVANIQGLWRENYVCVKKFAFARKMYIVLDQYKNTEVFDERSWLLGMPNLVLGDTTNAYFGTLHDFWSAEKEPTPSVLKNCRLSTPRFINRQTDYNNIMNAPVFGFCVEWTPARIASLKPKTLTSG